MKRTVLMMALLFATPAAAADLGGNCCADLEERVAELEATTVRKGNRVVSVQLYGQVNKALLIWDDGVDSDAYIVDNDYSSSRFGLRGSAPMKPGWSAGFRVEFEFQSAASNEVDAFDDDGTSEFRTRRASVYIESEQLGRVTIGQTSAATDDITMISIANTAGVSDVNPFYNQGFALRDKATGFALPLSWGDVASGLDTARGDFVRYDSPSLAGFIVSAAWGENDVYDVALRFKHEWQNLQFAFGAGYLNKADDVEEIKGSASLKHVPSGLFVNVAAGLQDRQGDLSVLLGEIGDGAEIGFLEGIDDPHFYFVQGGIEKNWFGKGATTIFAEYGRYEDFASLEGGFVDFDLLNLELAAFEGDIRTSVDRYGIGLVQRFDSAALDVYVVGQYWEIDASGEFAAVGGDLMGEMDRARCIETEESSCGDLFEDFWAVVLGTRIQF